MKRLTLVLLSVLLVCGACSLGPREEWVELMRQAAEKAREQRNAVVGIAVGLGVVENVGTQVPKPEISELRGDVDFTTLSGRLVSIKGRKGELRNRDLVYFLPRSSPAKGQERWVSFDFENKVEDEEDEIDVSDRRFAVGFPILAPFDAIDLMEGTLTGSIDRVGSETISGVATTHYSAKTAPDQAFLEIDDDDRRDGLNRVLETMGVTDDVLEFHVWLDDDGLVRRVRYVLEQHQDRVNVFSLTLRYDFVSYGNAKRVDIPATSDRVNTFEEFMTEFVREAVAPVG